MDLGVVGDCNTNYTLNYNYYSDHDGSDPDPHKHVWDFTSGKSAGVCNVNIPSGNPYYEADTCNLSKAFDDGFVKFNVSNYGIDGSNVLPYLPKEWSDSADLYDKARFSKIWFKNFKEYPSDPLTQYPQNYFHLIGASDKTGSYGESRAYYDVSYIYVKLLETDCPGSEAMCIRSTVNHEIGHQFNLNGCTDLQNCSPPPDNYGPHDYREWWLYGGEDCYSTNSCLMHPIGGLLHSGIDRFCKEDLLLGDPNCTNEEDKKESAMRTASDPE